LINESLAQPAPQTTRTTDLEHVSGIAARVLRGQELYLEYGDLITFERGVWHVPSRTDVTTVYEVALGTKGEFCECRDFEFRGGSCLHIVAATIAKAKSASCTSCGRRFAYRELIEVTEDHESLTFFPGDKLCRSECAGAHGIL
jgi:hypothetical protein